MLRILNFIEKNELEIRLSFYLIVINIGWIYFIINLFSKSNFSDDVSNYSFWIPSIAFIIYLVFKKFNSSEFLLFPPIRFLFFYILFQALIGNVIFLGNGMILNRQKYNELDEFIIVTHDEEKKHKETFIEKIYKKLFK